MGVPFGSGALEGGGNYLSTPWQSVRGGGGGDLTGAPGHCNPGDYHGDGIPYAERRPVQGGTPRSLTSWSHTLLIGGCKGAAIYTHQYRSPLKWLSCRLDAVITITYPPTLSFGTNFPPLSY